ncbi:MAG: NAD(P)/FAD-dependent oxidoreductase, partial [Salinisphaera sp.]|nr:NAD(P)/FAD-dependent oxidoreductase [Salinisphaera sp.]
MITRRRFLQAMGAGAALAGVGMASALRAADGQVLIAGGGFGGATCARYLRQLAPSLRITLVDRNASLVTGPFCNTVIAGINPLATITRDHRALAASGICFIQAEIAAIDPHRKGLRLSNGRSLSADRLVVSPGIAFDTEWISGYGPEVARTMPPAWPGGADELTILRGQLRAMPDNGLVVIASPPYPYRCPPAPYERASLVAWFLKRNKPRAKLLVLDAKDHFTAEPLFRSGWAALYGERIEWIGRSDGATVIAANASQRSVTTASGERVQADVINLIPPQRASALAKHADLTDISGWAPVDQRTFESTRYPGVHVLGDACVAAPMSKSAYAANC